MHQRNRSGRPEVGEYADYATEDISHVPTDDAVEALLATAGETIALYTSLSAESLGTPPYAPGKWTLKQILGHLVDDERILTYRALCIARGDTRPLPGFDENQYVAGTDFDRRSLADLLGEYRAVRSATVAFFESLTPEEWMRRGTTNGYAASVRGLAFHICGHELHHLRIIRTRYLDASDDAASPRSGANG